MRNKIAKAIQCGEPLCGFIFTKEPHKPHKYSYRKINAENASVIQIVPFSAMDRHARQQANKCIKYGGFIWEEILPGEDLNTSRYAETLIKNRQIEQERKQQMKQHNKHMRETSYIFVEIHGQNKFFNSLEEALCFFSSCINSSKKDLAKLIQKNINSCSMYQKYYWGSYNPSKVLRDIADYCEQRE